MPSPQLRQFTRRGDTAKPVSSQALTPGGSALRSRSSLQPQEESHARPHWQRPDRPVRRTDLRHQPEPGRHRRGAPRPRRRSATSTARVHGIQGVLEGRADRPRPRVEGDARGGGAARPAPRCARCARSPRARSASRRSRSSRQHDVRYFFYIGGNDSAETAHILNELAVAEELRAARCSTCRRRSTTTCASTTTARATARRRKFVAQAMMGDNHDNRSLPGHQDRRRHGPPRGLADRRQRARARSTRTTGRTWSTCPRRRSTLERFLGDVDRVYKQHGRCLVARLRGRARRRRARR